MSVKRCPNELTRPTDIHQPKYRYKRPTGQIVLYNQEDDEIEIRHIVPRRLETLHSQEATASNELTLANNSTGTGSSDRNESLQLRQHETPVCPTCLRPITRFSEGSWEPHMATELTSETNDSVTIDRDYFKFLARFLKLQHASLALVDDVHDIDQNSTLYYELDSKYDNNYYDRHLPHIPDASHFQADSEEGELTDREIAEDNSESGIAGTMLVQSAADKATPIRNMASEKRSTSSSVSADAFNQGYYERFFTEQKKLGKGLRGSVFSCQHILDSVYLGQYAVKKVAVGNNHQWLKRMLREVKLLESLRHPNVIEYKHSWLEMHRLTNFGPRVPCLFILMEYANGGNLQEYMEPNARSLDTGDSVASLKKRILKMRKQKHHGGSPLPFDFNTESNKSSSHPRILSIDQIWSFFSDICSGLAHLHQLQIIHRDLKHMNLLLHWNDPDNREEGGEIPRLMLTDFGECEILSHLEKRNRTGATGTLEFMAPELIEVDSKGRYLDSYSTKADMWSLGMVLYYLCYSKLPYSNIDDIDILRNDVLSLGQIDFTKIGRPEYAEEIPLELRNIMKQLLKHDESKRPDIGDVIHQITEKRNIWQTRRRDASIFELHDSDMASNGTATPGSMTPQTKGTSKVNRGDHSGSLRLKDPVGVSEFPIMLQPKSRRGDTSSAILDNTSSIPLSKVLRRHSVGVEGVNIRTDVSTVEKSEIVSRIMDDANVDIATITPEASSSKSTYSGKGDSTEPESNEKRRFEEVVGSVDSTMPASKRPRPIHFLSRNSWEYTFIAKTAVLLMKVYYLQSLDVVACNEQKASVQYLMGISLILSAFDIQHHNTMKLTVALLAANICIFCIWKIYYSYFC
ncbi:putative serine/threonine-protein kinase iks1 [Coemansia spiralis]|uniref:non-specific serine/threonine protein kinase n=1 Tax=Coemansia spiralis TaxID=417178 RepID=A0A9W8L064_9FUNG|nr:putative serine/threonine-protein kinase iks1 [Coemansia spiralis]